MPTPKMQTLAQPTPENTPIPGGGRWRWSDALPGWIEVLESGTPEPATAPIQEPANNLATETNPE